MLDEGILTEEALKAVEAEVIAEVEDSVTYADESPKPVPPLAFQRLQRRAAMLAGAPTVL